MTNVLFGIFFLIASGLVYLTSKKNSKREINKKKMYKAFLIVFVVYSLFEYYISKDFSNVVFAILVIMFLVFMGKKNKDNNI
ncbi:hypothetical protein [Clostridium akagii]|uniref:hypothetical protein n=1 Tax=Clostridium akagii TaxID=91623 RepID=UPI00047E7D5B|nr:hypothetical protein [Clostridium akagii]